MEDAGAIRLHSWMGKVSRQYDAPYHTKTTDTLSGTRHAHTWLPES